MVKDENEHTGRRPVDQGVGEVIRQPNKIGVSTHYDFDGHNLSAYQPVVQVRKFRTVRRRGHFSR